MHPVCVAHPSLDIDSSLDASDAGDGDVSDTSTLNTDAATIRGEDEKTTTCVTADRGGARGETKCGRSRQGNSSAPSSSSTSSDSPPSPSSLSSGSVSSSAPSSSVMSPCGELQPLVPEAFSHRRLCWKTRYHNAETPPSDLRLVTWNVDFSTPGSDVRLLCILSHLQKSVFASPPEPSCILLQELNLNSMRALKANKWVRRHFAVVCDFTESRPWRTYGNATLVSRSIRIEKAQVLYFSNSLMGRAAIFVDLLLRAPDGGKDDVRVVRVANTHLESLLVGTPMRPVQLQAIADMLRASEADGGVVGGDMNMIGDSKDQSIHVAAGLDDACLFPADPASHTWGYQPPCQYPPRRLDRVFFTGEAEGFIVDSVQVIGKGLRISNGQWASDHYGLSTSLAFTKPRK
ncbi:Endonuclease/exonuclease/phosphatase [Trametes polyzona]|nr:Endonuclease/exonuclease/phosphatase [Trametes polyzona]